MLAAASLDLLVPASVVSAAALYAAGLRRIRRRGRDARFPSIRARSFFAGLAVIEVALQGPVDTGAATRFSVHMVQHVLLAFVAAPLLLLGAPVTLALLSSSVSVRRRVVVSLLGSRTARLLTNPVVAWFAFLLVMWGTHMTRMYEVALGSEGVHALEHVAYLGSALLFWWPVIGLDPGSSRLSHPARILYLFLSMPQTALLGLAITSSAHVLYPSYAAAAAAGGFSALADQRLAGALMWGAAMLLVIPMLAFVLWDWMRADEREAARMDARIVQPRLGMGGGVT